MSMKKILFTPSTKAQPIKLCMNCKNLQRLPFVDLTFSKCLLFGRIDVITGKKTYNYADLVRSNDEECGAAAVYFEEKKDWF